MKTGGGCREMGWFRAGGEGEVGGGGGEMRRRRGRGGGGNFVLRRRFGLWEEERGRWEEEGGRHSIVRQQFCFAEEVRVVGGGGWEIQHSHAAILFCGGRSYSTTRTSALVRKKSRRSSFIEWIWDENSG